MRDWQFRRVPQWMQRALNSQQTDMPQSLVTASDDDSGKAFATVQATVETFQGGIGVAEPLTIFVEQTTPIAPNAPHVLLQGGAGISYLLIGLNVDTSGITAARRLWFGLLPLVEPPSAGSGTGCVLFDPTLPVATNPVDAVVSWKTINGTADGRVYIPEGYSLAWSTPDLAAGEEVVLVGVALKIPAGFKPF